jgi:hypothetical protein
MPFVTKGSIPALSSVTSAFRLSQTRRLELVLVLFLSAVTSFGQTYNWKNVVIKGGGFVSGLITHPNAPGVVYARTDIGGAYRWNAAGNSWIPLLDFALDANTYGIESFAIDPSDSNRLYIAASRNSSTLKYILVSTNQGATFTSYTPPFSLDGNARGRGGGERMVVDPNLHTILFYGTKSQGLYKSVNSGATWSLVNSFLVSTTANGVGIVFVQFVKSSGSPGSATPVIFAGLSQTNDNNLYRSADGGTNWLLVTNAAPFTQMPHHAAQDGLGNMYVTFNDTCGPNDNVTTGAVCKINLSTLASANVTPIRLSGEQGGWGGVSVDPQHPTNLVVSTVDRWWPSPYDQIYRSTNGGTSWKTTASGLPGNSSAPWSAVRTPHWCENVQIDPFNSNRAWYVTGYGVFSCTNLTAADSNKTVNWNFTSDGLEEMVPLGLASPPTGPYLLSQVGDQGGFRHFNVDVTPPLADYFPTHRGTSSGIDFAENNPNVIARLYAETNWGAYSLNGGTTWQDFATNTLPTINGSGSVAVSADGTRFVWIPSTVASGSRIAYYSTDHGATWTASTGGPTGTRVPIADRVNASKFYIYSSTRMYVSVNGGTNFTASGTLASGGGTPGAVFGHEGDLWVPLGSSGLAHSTDSGATFTVNSSVQATFVSVGMAAPGQSYPAIFVSATVGGVFGLYRSDDGGTSWTRINDNQHQFGIGNGWLHCLCADRRIYGRVYFGTEGRGVICGDLFSNTPPVLVPLSNWTVNVGQTVAFTASATDTDQPPQTLTFNLLSGPGSATLNTNTGAFSWRPFVTDASTVNPISLKVADSGSPSMSATQSFTVTVNPLTQPTTASLALNNGLFGFQVSGQAGPDYAVQVSSNLFDWNTLLITNSPLMPFQWTDTNPATLPAQFYRIKVGPPLP